MTRLPDAEHLGRPWRIHEIAAGFALEDVWALPTPGGPDDFPKLVAGATAMDPERSGPLPVRALFAIRWAIGGLLGWDAEHTGAGSRVASLRDRVPADLRGTADGVDFAGLPFSPLYLTGDEFAAEIANATVHGVLHLAWVPDGTGAWRGQMAVLVKRNGRLGAAYMAAIAPFRHLVVYPPMIRHIGRRWERELVA